MVDPLTIKLVTFDRSVIIETSKVIVALPCQNYVTDTVHIKIGLFNHILSWSSV